MPNRSSSTPPLIPTLTPPLPPPLTPPQKNSASSQLAIPAVVKSTFDYATIRSHFLPFALDQHGSRLIQLHLSAPSAATLSLITEDAMPHLLTLSIDVFGNYIVQKIIQISTSLPETVVEFLTENVIPLCHDQYGCRVIQASFCHERIIHIVASELHAQGKMKEMLTHVNGNHVVQKIVQLAGPQSYGVAEILQGDVDALSKDQYGCRFVQRMIEGGWGEHMEWDVKSCINHQYGNYIIQHLLVYGTAVSKNRVFSTLVRLGIVSLCRQKYSSNVVEKLLVSSGPSHVGYVVQTLSSFDLDGIPVCVKLVQDPFGNYVVRKAMEVAGGQHIQQLLKEWINEFKSSAYAKRVVAKIT